MNNSFFLQELEVDLKATKKNVEKILEKYRMYLGTIPNDIQPKMTPSYSILPPVKTNEFYSSTESIAIERIEYEQERDTFMQVIYEAVNNLKQDERFIIIKRYMEADMGYDPDIYAELGVGKTKYYAMKRQAMSRLAFMLKIEMYKKENSKRAI
ncbi:ArpU family phage packaging/lysis transcriptional regulator [Priestia taiwanensis]|uniref:ArpU family transcriptional regulator n=1 Tax=Priestia taiwanensis TaxID=1347902 RepID=A0A917EMW6_9BACI|nr:ArpU family phage packaging/lysis transcriptional regulator [Priestia taiwanensis]MBM7362709.1 ArpU family phage transcriptional regulator [Priestia taiwanensis]GGE64446.1 ArpU family transcriptional regulator [Priestia taiwanensis]